MVLAVGIQAAALVQGHTLAVAEDKAGVALATLHTAGRWHVAPDGEQVRTGGGAGGCAVRIMAVRGARQCCKKIKNLCNFFL